MFKRLLITLLAFQLVWNANAQHQASDFIGVWEGKRTSDLNGGANESATLTLRADGSFSESSGYLYSIYPSTQQWQYIDSSNQLYFTWVQTYYAGKAFYSSSTFYVATKTADSLVLHYDRDDLVEPLPHVCAFSMKNAAISAVVDLPSRQPVLLQTVDLLGRAVDPRSSGQLLIEQYDDGSTRKVWRVER